MGRNKVWLLPRRNCRPRCGILIATTEKIGKSHPGLSTINTRINWAKTQGDLELLDGGIALPKVDVDPPAPGSCPSQIWIQIYRPREQCCGFVYLADNICEHKSGLRKHHWIVLTELNGLPRKLTGFNNLAGNIGAPAVDFPLVKAVSGERVSECKFRVEVGSNFCELKCFDARFTGIFVELGESAKIVVVGFKAFSGFALSAFDFGALQLRIYCADHTARHLVLQIENIFELAVEPVGPKVRSRRSVNQLPCDANPVAGFTHATLEHVTHTKFAADLLDIDGFAFVSEAGITRYDEQGFG